MCIVRGSHFWQLGSIASLVTETTGGEILVDFGPNAVSEAISVPNFQNFPGGTCPQTPLACSHISVCSSLISMAVTV